MNYIHKFENYLIEDLDLAKPELKETRRGFGDALGPDGATHQSLEDVGIMRILPHMNVITPVDYNQTYRAIIECTKVNEPFYIRFYRDNSPNYTNPNAPFKLGKADTLY